MKQKIRDKLIIKKNHETSLDDNIQKVLFLFSREKN